jgi:ion channel-forming bestrophin family protein
MIDYDPRRWETQLLAGQGAVGPRIAFRIGLVGVWCLAVQLVHSFVYPIGVPATVHALVGVALGLLLVFRTNASYDRFWEGRKAWGCIVNNSRNIARAASGLLEDRPKLVKTVLQWAAVYPHACMRALRGETGLGPAADRLPPAEVTEVLASSHVPLAVAARISHALGEVRGTGVFAERSAVAIDSIVRGMIDDIGVCERIKKTPLPFAYVVHLRRALVLYCVTLPFTLVAQYSWTSVLFTLFITYILFGIDEIGVEIENPFGSDPNDLPLEDICATVEADVLGLLPKEPARTTGSD